MTILDYIKKQWFATGAYYHESFASFKSRMMQESVPVFLRPQVD